MQNKKTRKIEQLTIIIIFVFNFIYKDNALSNLRPIEFTITIEGLLDGIFQKFLSLTVSNEILIKIPNKKLFYINWIFNNEEKCFQIINAEFQHLPVEVFNIASFIKLIKIKFETNICP